MKKHKKSIYIAACIITLLIVLDARLFSSFFTDDYLVRYERFLKYSLGDFVVIRDSEDHTYVRFDVWELQYTHQNGNSGTFHFSNWEGTHFRNYVSNHARSTAGAHLESEIATQYFTNVSSRVISVHPAEEVARSVYRWHWGDDDVTILVTEITRSHQVLNHRSGLRLHSITPQELVSDWGVSFDISVVVHNYSSYERMIEQLKGMTRTLSAYLEQDETRIFFTIHDNDEAPFDVSEINFSGTYYRQTDTFETKTEREQLEE